MRPAREIPLPELLEGLLAPGEEPPSLPVRGIGDDSRRVEEGWLFCAVPGHRRDGADFVPQARRRGARAVLAARPLPGLDLPCLVAPDIRRAAAIASHRFHGRPSRRVACAGVTGTNGKTTVCHLVAGILEEAGRRTGVLGTLGYRLGAERRPAPTTTPGPVTTQELLGEMAEGGFQACLMEVSSHALTQDRTAGIEWRAAAFTNLTRDHLDYHGSMEEYAKAKMKLFAALPPGARAVVNLDDPLAGRILAALPSGVEGLACSLDPGKGAAITLLERRRRGWGYALELDLAGHRVRAGLPLAGEFNLENALVALGLALALGLTPSAVAAGLGRAAPVPGRLERVAPVRPGLPAVCVDYAHTPDALARALAALRPFCPGRLGLVFGCGGERDRGKRPLMGEIAARLADRVWITSDNPRGEDPAAIAAQVAAGLGGRAARVELDRREAIRLALAEAEEGDLVLVAGKGHEDYQLLAGERRHFDDRETVRDLLCGR